MVLGYYGRGEVAYLMNCRLKEYQKKLIRAEELIGICKPGTRVFLEQGPGEPLGVVREMMRQASRLKGIQLVIVPLPGVNKVPFVAPEYTEHWQIYSFFGGPALSRAIAEKRVEYVPINLSEIPAALHGVWRPDVAVIQVSPPDSAGFCSLGITVDYNRAAVDAAALVIAQVNRNMPVTCGDAAVHLSEITCIWEEDTELIQVPPTEPGEVEKQIATHVASLVPDGSTIQIGIGSVPDAILTALMDKRDLGIHSGLFSDRMLDLVEAGVVTGKKKTINPRKVVTGLLLGTERLYRFCHRNPLVELYPTTYTHNRAIVSRLDNFISINSVVEIDLTGQVNSEVINGNQISGIGGQIDFARIARLSRGGKAIFAMPSVARGKSKIVPRLSPDVPVSTARVEVDYVVTEFGIAELRHRSLRERAKALVQIAHPDFREELKSWVQKI